MEIRNGIKEELKKKASLNKWVANRRGVCGNMVSSFPYVIFLVDSLCKLAYCPHWGERIEL
jgi:hypothetical protein